MGATTRKTGTAKLMDLGRQVIRAEELFGKGSRQHERAVTAWRKQQQRLGITREG